LVLNCVVHRSATVSTRTYDLAKGDVSGLIALAISMRSTGKFPQLVEACVAHCLSKLRVVRTPLVAGKDDDIMMHRAAVLDTVFGCQEARQQCGRALRPGIIAVSAQRVFYEQLFNMDISDVDNVWHYAPDGVSEDDVRKLFKRNLKKALLPRMLPFFPRHRWTGAFSVMQFTMLLACTHGILQAVVPQWSSPGSKRQKPSAGGIRDIVDNGYESADDAANNVTTIVDVASVLDPKASISQDVSP
jgi:hypothetical protein